MFFTSTSPFDIILHEQWFTSSSASPFDRHEQFFHLDISDEVFFL